MHGQSENFDRPALDGEFISDLPTARVTSGATNYAPLPQSATAHFRTGRAKEVFVAPLKQF
jgi:hypothetical protein